MTYWRCHFHVVWTTLNRMPAIDAEREATIARCIVSVADEKNLILHAFGIVEEHVHVAVSIPPRWSVSEIVKTIKGSSSHQLGSSISELFGEWPGWQGEYGVLTFGDSSMDRIVNYVRNQKAHHAENTTWNALERDDRERNGKPSA